jgi:hypothetical protein
MNVRQLNYYLLWGFKLLAGLGEDLGRLAFVSCFLSAGGGGDLALGGS